MICSRLRHIEDLTYELFLSLVCTNSPRSGQREPLVWPVCPPGSPAALQASAAAATAMPSGSSSFPASPRRPGPFLGAAWRAQGQARAVLVPAGVQLLVGTRGARVHLHLPSTLSPGLSITRLEPTRRAHSTFLSSRIHAPSQAISERPRQSLPDRCLCPRSLTPPTQLGL